MVPPPPALRPDGSGPARPRLSAASRSPASSHFTSMLARAATLSFERSASSREESRRVRISSAARPPAATDAGHERGRPVDDRGPRRLCDPVGDEDERRFGLVRTDDVLRQRSERPAPVRDEVHALSGYERRPDRREVRAVLQPEAELLAEGVQGRYAQRVARGGDDGRGPEGVRHPSGEGVRAARRGRRRGRRRTGPRRPRSRRLDRRACSPAAGRRGGRRRRWRGRGLCRRTRSRPCGALLWACPRRGGRRARRRRGGRRCGGRSRWRL